MKRKLSIYVIILVSMLFLPLSYSLSEPSKIRILFVGNSLTYVNDLPNIIAQLAKSRGFSIEYDSYAPGGYRLSQHASDPALMEKINQGKWDFVVLQEQSQMPALSQEQVERDVYPYAQRLSQMIRQANPKTHVVFYMTMAQKDGDRQNMKIIPEVGTYEGMQDRINFSYTRMAQQNRGLLVPVGLVWKNVRQGKTALELYSDDRHPNITGSYLAACVFFTALFKENPIGLPHPQGIDNATAAYLQEMTEGVIQSQSWDWE